MRFAHIGVILGLLLITKTTCAIEPDYIRPLYDVAIKKNITYGKGRVNGSLGKKLEKLKLDLYLPVGDTSKNGRPAVLLIHGGGFNFGSKNIGELPGIARDIASRGYVVANIDYRLAGNEPSPTGATKALLKAPYLNTGGRVFSGKEKRTVISAFEDARKALQWLESNSNAYNIDASRIATYGLSAGAIIAVNVAYTMDDFDIDTPSVAAVVSMYGAQLINSRINKGDAPLFIGHRVADPSVPFAHSKQLYRRAREVGVPVEIYPIAEKSKPQSDRRLEKAKRRPGEGHMISRFEEVEPGVTLLNKVLLFLKKALYQPDSLPKEYCSHSNELECQRLRAEA